MNGNFWTRGLRVSFYAFVALLLVWGAVAISGVGFLKNSDNKTDSDLSPSPTNSTCQTWQTGPSDYSKNRWFADGIAEIREAKTDKQARTAANVWLDKVKTDPVLLAGAAKYMLEEDVDKTDLSSNDCATPEAVDLVTEIGVVLGQSDISSDDAPKDGHNSGVDNGEVVGSDDSGVYGDLTAIKVVKPNGKIIWIMARCGNPVTKGKPPVPHGPTDNPPPPEEPPPTNPPPGNPGKDPSLDPAAQGNVPEQVTGKAPPPRQDHYQPTKPADPPKTYTPPPTPKPKPPTGSKPTTQPSNPPATGSNDGDNGGTIDQPDW